MLLVPTYVAPSAIQGLGVFAAEPVTEGAPIWRFEPGIDLTHARRAIGQGEEITCDYRECCLDWPGFA